MKKIALLLVALAAACVQTPTSPGGGEENGGQAPDDQPAIPEHETFLRNPTVLSADEILAILPAAYEPEIRLKGLSTGWRTVDGKRVWAGTGDVTMRLHSLTVRTAKLSLTLVADQPEPEVLLQASGNADVAYSVRGVGSRDSGRLITIRNDRSMTVD